MSACKQMRPEFCSDASITECSSDLGAGPRVVTEVHLSGIQGQPGQPHGGRVTLMVQEFNG